MSSGDSDTENTVKSSSEEDKINTKSFVRGFIHIILDAYEKYRRYGMPKFDQTVKARWSAKTNQCRNVRC